MWIAFRSCLLCQWIEGDKYLYPERERNLTNNSILPDYNKQEYVAISESGRVTEAETFMTVPSTSGASCCTVISCFWSSASWSSPWAARQLPVRVPGDRQISREKPQAPEGLFLRSKDQAHTGTLVPNKTEKSGQSAPAEVNLDPPFSIPNAFVNLVWIDIAPFPVCTREQSCYSPAHFVSNRQKQDCTSV